MNSFMLGSLFILYFVVAQASAAFIEFETTPQSSIGSCSNVDVNTNTSRVECTSVDGPTYLQTVLNVVATGLTDAPVWFNAFWVLIHAFILVAGVILISTFFIGVITGGAT